MHLRGCMMTQRGIERGLGAGSLLCFVAMILIFMVLPFAPSPAPAAPASHGTVPRPQAQAARRPSGLARSPHVAVTAAQPVELGLGAYLLLLSGGLFWLGTVLAGFWRWRRRIRVRAEIWAEARHAVAARI